MEVVKESGDTKILKRKKGKRYAVMKGNNYVHGKEKEDILVKEGLVTLSKPNPNKPKEETPAEETPAES